MNSKKAFIHVALFFLTMALIVFALNGRAYFYLEEHFATYIGWGVYALYFVFLAWALLVFKWCFYGPHDSALANLIRFALYGSSMFMGMVALVFVSYWISAISSGTAP
jgi:hypothetical protein